MRDYVADLLSYIDHSPTPYHAVQQTRRRLEAAGYQQLAENDVWELSSGDRHWVVRSEGSLVAFEVGALPPAQAGFRVVGAHTDSPNLRLKPRADLSAHGYRQLGVEPYGGVLLHTWLDRDLSLAGRVSLQRSDGVETRLIDFGRPLLRVPNLAIHLDREVRKQGLKLNEQQHLVPVIGLEDAPALAELLATELRAQGAQDVETLAESVLRARERVRNEARRRVAMRLEYLRQRLFALREHGVEPDDPVLGLEPGGPQRSNRRIRPGTRRVGIAIHDGSIRERVEEGSQALSTSLDAHTVSS